MKSFSLRRTVQISLTALLSTGLLVAQFGPMPTAGPPASSRSIKGQTAPKVTPLTLWYRSPAKLWTDALAIGNGRLGAMIFGQPDHDRFQLNDITVWSGGPDAATPTVVDAYEAAAGHPRGA